MANDSISTDPKMKEEARRVAAQSSIPRPPYNTEKIAQEEFERVIDKRYCDKTFDEVWSQLTKDVASAPASSEDIYGQFTETEFRQLVTAMFYGVNGFFLEYAGKQSTERGQVLQRAAMYTVNDRMKLEERKLSTQIDLQNGIMRKLVTSNTRTCILHPEGCPEESQVPSAVRSILGKLLGGR